MNFIQTLAISALPIIFAITLHEAAHGYVARHFGDPTAWQLGRISLNPLRHVDLIGTLLVPALILLVSAGGLLFGWAKPVPVDFGKLRRPKQDMLWVAAAGAGAAALLLDGRDAQAQPANAVVFTHVDVANPDQVQRDVALTLTATHLVYGQGGGYWKSSELPNESSLVLNFTEYKGYFIKQWDEVNGVETTTFSGMSDQGEALFGIKKTED